MSCLENVRVHKFNVEKWGGTTQDRDPKEVVLWDVSFSPQDDAIVAN